MQSNEWEADCGCPLIFTVLGLDPGLADFGYCVLEYRNGLPTLMEAGAWRTKPGEGDRLVDRFTRAQFLGRELHKVMLRHAPDLVAVEAAIVGGAGGVIAAVSSGYAAGVIAAVVAPSPAEVVITRARDWRRALLGNIGDERESAAHLAVERLLDGRGYDPVLTSLKKGVRTHALDACGLALATMRGRRGGAR